MLRPMGQVLNSGGMELGWGQGSEGQCGGGSRARSALPKDPVTSGQGAYGRSAEMQDQQRGSWWRDRKRQQRGGCESCRRRQWPVLKARGDGTGPTS